MTTVAEHTAGSGMLRLVEELYPICRSITGDGVRQTLAIVGRSIPLTVHEVPSGTQVFDWTVPPEWNIRDAYIRNARGERVVDFGRCNLHVVSYSVPVRTRMSGEALRKQLHWIPGRPDAIPYRTSYYDRGWGFCVTERQMQALTDNEYEVVIDSSLEPGSLTYGEWYLRGESTDEVLISCHVCHPSLGNDNLSGIAVATALAERLASAPRRYSYRALFIPGTIGAITWLALNERTVDRVKHGLVLTGVGDPGHLTYKKSRRGDTEIDRAFAHVLQHAGRPYDIVEFSPYGYDERQYCSPGFNLPVGCLMRTPFGQYPQYHTSDDNLEFVSQESLHGTLDACAAVLEAIEGNATYVNLNPKCEPQLGRRGLYAAVGGTSDARTIQMAMLWVLNLSDGTRSLLDIANRSGMAFATIRHAASLLVEHQLLRDAGPC